MKRLLPLLCALLPSSFLAAQTLQQPPSERLRHVRVERDDARALSEQLEFAGFDVLEGSVQPGSLELIVTDASFLELRRMGLSPIFIAVGRPFRDIQAERAGVDDPADLPPNGYPDLNGVRTQMQAAAASFPAICQYVNLTTKYSLPRTAGNRQITAIKISDNVAQDEDEPAFLMIAAVHCREVVTPVIALDVIDRLTSMYGVDPAITSMVDNNEIWIIPVGNVDGYNHVFTANSFWRKNRRQFPQGIGVDVNRNFPFGWSSGCAGSTNVGSETYKGPSPASEVETQTIMALSEDQRFTKVLDYHSSGRETLWEYACNTHPLASFLMFQAVALSNASGYGGRNRPPSANGEHYEWQLAQYSSHAFLTETATQFQPPFTAAQDEANLVWPGTVYFLQQPIPVSGHVTDVCTGDPVEASITYPDLPFTNGETNTSEPKFGRYHAFLPPGVHTLDFAAPGYATQSIDVTVVEGGATTLEVQLVPAATASAVVRNGTGVNSVCYTNVTPPVLGGTWTSQVNHAAHPGATFTVILVHVGSATGPVVSAGELLINLGSPKLFQSLVLSSGTVDIHTHQVPSMPCLAGAFSASQAAIIGGGGPELCNAIDLTLGQ